MTDDSGAEKAALSTVWPQSHQLLCHLHIAQAEWRWLMESKNGIPKEKRQMLMSIFRKVILQKNSSFQSQPKLPFHYGPKFYLLIDVNDSFSRS